MDTVTASPINHDNGNQKPREINITESLVYAFRRKNFVNVLLLPGIVATALIIWGTDTTGSSSSDSSFSQFGSWVATPILLMFLGYGWNLINELHNGGYDAEAPDWTLEKCIRACWDGVKVAAVFFLVFLLLFSLETLVQILVSCSAGDNYLPDVLAELPSNFVRNILHIDTGSNQRKLTTQKVITTGGEPTEYEIELASVQKQPLKNIDPTAEIDPVAAINRNLEANSIIAKQSVPQQKDGIGISDADIQRYVDETNRPKTIQHRKELADFSKMLRHNHKNVQAYISRGDANYQLNRFSEAIADYTKALSYDPKNAEGYSKRALVYAHLGKESITWNQNHQNAIDDYGLAINLAPSRYEYYEKRAAIFNLTLRNQEAISDYSKAISLNRNAASAFFQRATIFDRLKDYKRAVEDYNTVLSLDTLNFDASNNRREDYRELARSWGGAEFWNSASPWLQGICVIPSLLLLPFVGAALTQSAESKSLRSLLNIRRTWRAGCTCYKKALMVSVAVAIILALCVFGFSSSMQDHVQKYVWIFGPVIVLTIFASFHLVAQAFDAYRDD